MRSRAWPHRASGLRVCIGPRPDPFLVEAIGRAGGTVVEMDAAEMVVWTIFEPTELPPLLHAGVRWVQLAGAGVERWIEAGAVDVGRTWMSAAGASSEAIADHALALILGGLRRLGECARAGEWDRSLQGRTLRGENVVIVGAGGIGRALISMLAPHAVEITAVTRRGVPVPGAARTVRAEQVGEVLGEAGVVVLAAPATSSTRHLIGAPALAAMRGDAVLVNVARGSLIDTPALVAALDAAEIGAAALDVTDPEPLPAGHPLWRHDRAIVTPHVATPGDDWATGLARRVEENITRIAAGGEPLGVIDLERGY